MITIKSRSKGTRETLALMDRVINNEIFTDEWVADLCVRNGLKYIINKCGFNHKKPIKILEPFAGYGRLGYGLLKCLKNVTEIDFVEIKDEFRFNAIGVNDLDNCSIIDQISSERPEVKVGDYWGQDFFKWASEYAFNRYDLIILNPPFTPVVQVTEPALIHCLDMLEDDGFIFMFGSMAFINNGDQRMERLSEHIEHIYCLPRVAFKGQSSVHSVFFIASKRLKRDYEKQFIIKGD